MRPALLLLLLPLLASAQGLPGSESVILRVDAESVYAHLFRPAAKGRAPAMVIVHGFGGVSDAREGFWARELAAFGVASLVVESFTARGVGSSIDDQSRVSTAHSTFSTVNWPTRTLRRFMTRPSTVDPSAIEN